MASELPAEVLVRILAPLPPVDLVAARGVCRWWRAVVRGMEARDRSFRFPCGAVDFVVHQRAMAATACHLGQVADWVYLNGLGHKGPARVPCTCGVLLEDDCRDAMFASFHELATRPHARAVALLKSEYRDRHAAPLPPARWEVLARERALALELWRLADVLQRDVFYHHHDTPVMDGGVSATWLPCWVWLPDAAVRPQSTAQLRRLVRDTMELDQPGVTDLIARLSRAADAHAYYQQQADSDEDAEAEEKADWPKNWMDAWQVDMSDRASSLAGDHRDDGGRDDFEDLPPSLLPDRSSVSLLGWQRWQYLARRSAACWRLYVRRRRALGDDDNTILTQNRRGYGGRWWRSVDEKTASKDGQVATIDRIRRDVERLCRYATVVHNLNDECNGQYTSQVWFGGLSPGGHLVGCVANVLLA